MTEELTEMTFLSRGIDYLEDLGAKLRDLKGFTTLANELIQNADDARAKVMLIDVGDEGLTVDNDGVFSACDHVEATECAWKTTKGHMCDFHRFRLVGSGDKRRQEGTTGAFGFGFAAVYQVTDRPELFSAGRHWTLQEERPETERIIQYHGCSRCRAADLPGTRFFLPWAKDPDSELRRALSVEAFTEKDRNELLEQLVRSLPTAMIYLKNLQSVTIKDRGCLRLQLERIVEERKVLIAGGDEDRVWHLVQGNFQSAADGIRKRYPGLIEGKRSTTVTLAIPEEAINDGRVCVCLPTEFSTGFQFHVNADFYPTRDRKRILLDSDYQGKWNRAAIAAAAKALAEDLSSLRDTLSHGRLWEVLNSVYRVHQEQKEREGSAALSEFWKTLAPNLRHTAVFFTANRQWCAADDVYLLYEKQEETASSVLSQMGIACLHSDLRPYFNILRTEEVGVSFLELDVLVRTLEDLGLEKRVPRDKLPGFLQEEGNLDILWNELETLLNRKGRSEVAKGQRTRLAGSAVAVGSDGALWPCNQVYRTDDRTRDVFGAIDSTIPFMSACGKPGGTLESLCPEFSPEIALHFVERRLGTLADEEGPVELDISSVLHWFEDRRKEVLGEPKVKAALAALPIFPTAQGRRPLTELVLPGGFEDPLGLADVVDLTKLGARRDFLRDLGAEELTFRGYAVEHLPAAFRQNALRSEKRRAIVHLLADRIGEIRDDFEVEEVLCDLPIVECVDGEFRRPPEVFFDVADLGELFGEQANQAVLPRERAEAVRDLYSWLGVAEAPCLADIAERVENLVAKPPTPRSIKQIRHVFAHLGGRASAGELNEDNCEPFRRMAWLPGRGHQERWFKPGELRAVFVDYLFESQAIFLDVERTTQNQSAPLLRLLGVPNQPTVAQVADHLLWCSENGKKVNNEVYRWLNDNAETQSVGGLAGKACLLLNGAYVRPDQVFWGEHPFGHFRYRLGQEMRSYARLLHRLGVKESPDCQDALAVIAEIEQKYAPGNLFVEEADLGILLGCWQILGEELDRSVDDEDLAEEMRETLEGLSARKVIADRRGLLCRPGWLLFEDRQGIAVKFEETLGNSIIPRRQKAWRAMQLAGVRHLSDALRSELVECQDAREDAFVFERIQERRQELRRVVERSIESHTTPDTNSLLRQINCKAADELVIQYRVEGFGTIPLSEPENVKAHYHRESHILFSCPVNGTPPWTAIARELALALCPGSEPGGLASGIKEVLAADDAQTANTVLDELGYPMALEAVATPTATTDEPIQDFGGEETTGREPLGTPEDGAEGDSEVDEVKVITAEQPTPGQDVITPEQAIESILRPSVRQPTPPPEELDKTDRPGGTGGSGDNTQGDRGTRKGQRRKPSPNRAKLRTYVVPGIGGEAGQPAEAAGGRNPVDEAGMARVLEFEKMAGREPTPMPVTHPGYDVESFNGANEIERFIEVKSLTGAWSSLGAALTDTQFEKADEQGDRYWLYVVERAQEDDFRIYRIRDPARKVNQFIFDDGWRSLAEEDEVEPSSSEDSE